MPCVTCCSFPNGYLTLIPALLSVVAYVLTSNSLWSCNYAETKELGIGVGLILYERVNWLDDDFWFSGFDDEFWSMLADSESYSYSCVIYNSSTPSSSLALDSIFKAARALGIFAWLIGFTMMVVVWSVASCVAAPKSGWRIIGSFFFIIGLFQLFTILILASNVCTYGCNLKSGGITSIISFILCWIIAITCFKIPEPKQTNSPPPPLVASVTTSPTPVQLEIPARTAAPAMATIETTTQHVEADGATVIETTKTYPDGSSIVTTSMIPPTVAKMSPDINFDT